MGKFLQLYNEKFSEAILTPAVVIGGTALAFIAGLKALVIVALFIGLVALEDKYLLNKEEK